MIIQSILYPCDVCRNSEIYYQSKVSFEEKANCIVIPARSQLSFFSYMNNFDIDFWKRYTTIANVNFIAEILGKGIVYLKCKTKDGDIVISKSVFYTEDVKKYQEIKFDFNLNEQSGMCYLEVQSESDVEVRKARFETNDILSYNKRVQLSLNICTYHRNIDITRNYKQLINSRFFDEDDLLYGKMSLVIVDNGSEMNKINDFNIHIVHNDNTGGSGGFKRGLEEIRSTCVGTTHVIFMDDDIKFIPETLYRLYALLSFMKEEYLNETVAGRMFRMDKTHIQYTAAEIWNAGDIKHIGLNADMTKIENVVNANQNEGAQYGGWWFCCYPMEFVKTNDPLPFFLHCDDVEYGLRHGGTPIILNGIQVWHETYEYRQSAIITYYDVRNSLIVNELYNIMQDKQYILNSWLNKISFYHLNKMYNNERMAILAMQDYLHGIKACLEIDVKKKHNQLVSYKQANRYVNAFLWRYVKRKLLRKENRNEV